MTLTPELTLFKTSMLERINARLKELYVEYANTAGIRINYNNLYKTLKKDVLYTERKSTDTMYPEQGRQDKIFIQEYVAARHQIGVTLKKDAYWGFIDKWAHDYLKVSDEEMALFIRLILRKYNLPFVVEPGLGVLITAEERRLFRIALGQKPFDIGRGKPTPEKVAEVKEIFNQLKASEPELCKTHRIESMKWNQLKEEGLLSELIGEKKVEAVLAPIRNIGKATEKTEQTQGTDLMVCASCGTQALKAGQKMCHECGVKFPSLEVCTCGTVALKESQKRCHECGELFPSLKTESVAQPQTVHVPVQKTVQQPVSKPVMIETPWGPSELVEGDDAFDFGEPVVEAPKKPSLQERREWGLYIKGTYLQGRNLGASDIAFIAQEIGFQYGLCIEGLYLPESSEAFREVVDTLEHIVQRSAEERKTADVEVKQETEQAFETDIPDFDVDAIGAEQWVGEDPFAEDFAEEMEEVCQEQTTHRSEPVSEFGRDPFADWTDDDEAALEREISNDRRQRQEDDLFAA